MSAPLRLALAQTNFCVGDIDGNTARIVRQVGEAVTRLDADVVVFPELAVTGYPPEDLLFRPGLHRRVSAALDTIAKASEHTHVVVGYPEKSDGQLFNSCAVFFRGEQIANYRKQHLPNYAVFDEKRYFDAGESACVIDIKGYAVAFSICEDIWETSTAIQAREAGAELICNINASPYHLQKHEERLNAVKAAAVCARLPITYVNSVGGQDELLFDGASFALNAAGELVAQAAAFDEKWLLANADKTTHGVELSGDINPLVSDDGAVYAALVMGVRDYVQKNRFDGCVLGLSGGIDSALTLAIACDALGADCISAVSMPSRYTADMSITDAEEEARLLGCNFSIVPIENVVAAFSEAIEPLLPSDYSSVTSENVQARSRGVILMAVSNASRRMVLATGNKSEMAVGYATLYGDMAGGFAPLKDISKTLVYRLARWRNTQSPVIPERVITRAPSAELAPDQKDSDSLPPYDILDPILEMYIEQDKTPREIAAAGYDFDTARRVAAMVDRNEYKRRQAAPGVRITKRAFGRDRRFPITSRYNEQQPASAPASAELQKSQDDSGS